MGGGNHSEIEVALAKKCLKLYDRLGQLYNYAEMQKFFGIPPQPYHFDRPQVFHTKQFQKHFDLLTLRNGYRADSPKITFKNPKIRIGTGKPEWGAEYGKQYFIITWEEALVTEEQNIDARR